MRRPVVPLRSAHACAAAGIARYALDDHPGQHFPSVYSRFIGQLSQSVKCFLANIDLERPSCDSDARFFALAWNCSEIFF